MSMLDCFFSNKYANRADLFEGLSIWQNETYRKLQGTYPVIFLSFAAVKAGNLEDAKTQIKQEITRLYWENRNLMKEDRKLMGTTKTRERQGARKRRGTERKGSKDGLGMREGQERPYSPMAIPLYQTLPS